MEKLKGGVADGKSLADIAKKHGVSLEHIKTQAKMGFKFEKEHTSDRDEMLEIIKDHLWENPDAYTVISKTETTEQMDASCSGSFEAPMSGMPIVKKTMPRQEEVKEVTDSSSSGSYDVSFSSGRKNPLSIEGPSSIKTRRSTMKKNNTPMWGGPGSKFVGVKEKCKKYPYCNEGPGAIETYNEGKMEYTKDELVKLMTEEVFIDNMEPTDIKSIIEESLFSEVKDRILAEQEGVYKTDTPELMDKFPSLIPFENRIEKIKNIGGADKFGVVLLIADLTPDELEELHGNLHKDILKNGLENYDLHVDIASKSSQLWAKIKIEASDELGSELNENKETMKKIDLLKQIQESVKKEKEAKKVCKECGKAICECGKLAENDKPAKKKKVLKLKESNLIAMINKIVSEAIPGVSETERVQKQSKKFNDEYLSDVDKKMKDYADFDGNDKPDFPKPIGKGEKVAYEETSENQEYIDNNRGGNSLDLNYDGPETENEPPESFDKRVQDSLSGDQTMGNAQDDDTANVVKSDLGKKLHKGIKTKRDAKNAQPMYKKDEQPVTEAEEVKSVVAEVKKVEPIVAEEIKRMRSISGYNEKTQ